MPLETSRIISKLDSSNDIFAGLPSCDLIIDRSPIETLLTSHRCFVTSLAANINVQTRCELAVKAHPPLYLFNLTRFISAPGGRFRLLSADTLTIAVLFVGDWAFATTRPQA